MSTGVWGQIVVDRSGHLAPYLQIANAIRHRIATNVAAPSTALPSVRALAEQVGVTSATVSRAYQLLSGEGLVESQVGLGTLVRDTERLVFNASQRTSADLRGAIDKVLTPLLQLGYSPAEVRDAVDWRLSRALREHRVCVVYDEGPVLEKYLAIMGRELAPLGVRVEGAMFAALSDQRQLSRDSLAQTTRILTSLGLLRPVREALEQHGLAPPISVILTELSLATIEALGRIPKDALVLLVSEERYRNSILGVLRDYVPPKNLRVLHDLGQDSVGRGIQQCDVLVHSLGTRRLVETQSQGDVLTITMDYQVRQDAMMRLRASFTDETLQIGPHERDT